MRLSLLAALFLAMPCSSAQPQLKVSDNKRFLVTAEGKPFFYLGDTAWELFHRLTREDADVYLKDRAARKFTVIQAVAIAEFDGLTAPNAYGHLPLADNDPTKPNEDYFKHVDWVVNRANELGLYVAFLPTWGDKVGPKAWGKGPEIFTVNNARVYGEWLGQRYKDRGIIWMLGGDRNPDSTGRATIWRELAAGLRKGDGGTHLMTFHPSGGRCSSEWFHDDAWLDFNCWQTGHNTDVPVADRIAKDYARMPIKPVFDGEPLYEDHPLGFKAKEFGYSNAADIRRAAYWGVFAGGHGFTYGNHSMWQFFDKGRVPVNGPIKDWHEALRAPGGDQVRHLRALIESRPFLTRIPDQSLLISDPSAGTKRVQATRDSAGTYAFVYCPAGRPVEIRMTKLMGDAFKAWWFDPRTGAAKEIDKDISAKPEMFQPPTPGENLDWVLVLDRKAANYGPPGK
ncbi:MAG TPA: glycoside hydrolase family 140 protein [Gemmataceae bacterium]|jgi:hypothetical protein|nr:glycoside hydrolase family 140 protein [Gemmataceae bacterium]